MSRADWRQPPLHRRLRAVHRRPAHGARPAHGGARQPDRRRRHGRSRSSATLLDDRIGDWGLIAVGVAIGTAIGVPAARSVKMTAMPQMVALFNGVGGGAVALISLVEFREGATTSPLESLIPIVFAAIIGSISFWGSNVAFAKLQELELGQARASRALTLLNLGARGWSTLALAVIIVAGADAEIALLAAARRSRACSASPRCCRSAAPTCRS